MEKQTLAHQVGQAGGALVRLKGDLGRAKGELNSATRNLTTGGVVLLIGILGLVGYFAFHIECANVLAAIALVIGGVMVGTALAKAFGARRMVGTTTDKIASAQAELDELKAQPSGAE
jgi:hypothetical protein